MPGQVARLGWAVQAERLWFGGGKMSVPAEAVFSADGKMSVPAPSTDQQHGSMMSESVIKEVHKDQEP